MSKGSVICLNPGNQKRWLGLILVLFVCIAGFSSPFQHYASFPRQLKMFSGQNAKLSLAMPVTARVTVKDPGILQVNGQSVPSFSVNLKDPITLKPAHTGETEMKLSFFGAIPFKTVKVNVVPDLKVIPGGQTIGVKVKSAGILVVGHHLITVAPGKKVSPGEDARLQVGDLITKINGTPLNDVSKVSDLVKSSGEEKKPLALEVKRQNEILKLSLTPQYDIDDKSYRLGLYIRDSAAGVGTLTFYAPEQKTYGALGHVITDMDTQTAIEVGGGEILHSNVTSISKSQNGDPGEKIAHFFREGKVLGNIEKNTPFGIFGKMFSAPDHSYDNEAIPVAFANEVKEGKAQIYTVVNGQKVEKFDIEVTHVTKQDFPATKGLVIRITDPRLLEKTGGIVQGMSGSPIIQNGKIIGAVTHVFVNDPTSGYGCFIEWMLRDAGVMDGPDSEQRKAG